MTFCVEQEIDFKSFPPSSSPSSSFCMCISYSLENSNGGYFGFWSSGYLAPACPPVILPPGLGQGCRRENQRQDAQTGCCPTSEGWNPASRVLIGPSINSSTRARPQGLPPSYSPWLEIQTEHGASKAWNNLRTLCLLWGGRPCA